MGRKKYIAAGLLLAALAIAIYLFISDKGSAWKGKSVIMAFGDSLTYGQGDRDEQGYVEKLQNKLNREYTGTEFIIENHGVKGRESGGVLKELAEPKTAANLKNADFFILFIGTNDFLNSNGGNLEKIHPSKIKEGRETYLRNVKMILKIMKAANEEAPILVIGLYNPYPEGGENVEPYIDEWNRSTAQIADKEEGVAYIPTNDLFKGKDKKDYFSDSLHLNKKGYWLLEERILQRYSFNKDE